MNPAAPPDLPRARAALARGDAHGCLQALGPAPGGGEPVARLLEATARLMLGERTEGLGGLARLAEDLEAEPAPDRALLAGVYKNLAIGRIQSGEPLGGIEALQRAVDLDPQDPETRHALAALLLEQGRDREALEHARRAVALRPEPLQPRLTLAEALVRADDLAAAGAVLEPGIARSPRHVEGLLALARIHGELGRMAELEALLARIPDHPVAAQARLMALHYDPARTPAEVRAAHQDWGRRLREQVGPVSPPRPEDPDPERPLRVGYLGADFRAHSCAHFLEPLLRAHDPRAVEVLVFSAAAGGDARTETFRGLAAEWHPVHGLDDAALAVRIRSARVDLLVELGGHTAGSRLAVLARRPAPVQLSWLGYPTATGLDALEGRISDSRVDPPGATDGDAETVLRIDPSYLCWMPPAGLPARRPADRRGAPFTFGSFNHFAKLNGAVIATWAALLRRSPGSRLLLKARGSQSPEVRDRIAGSFAEEGVPVRRLEFLPFQPTAASHLPLYAEIDLALDPFPYNGVTTTLEALWMGVPVLALEGASSLGRQSAALLRTLALDTWVAADRAGYLEAGLRAAQDPAPLADLGGGLRERLQRSPLCDAPGFARRMEHLYRRLWREACARAQTGA